MDRWKLIQVIRLFQVVYYKLCCSCVPNMCTWAAAGWQMQWNSGGVNDHNRISACVHAASSSRPQSPQYAISFSSVIVSFPVLKVRKPFSLLSTTFMATANKRLDMNTHSKAICQMTKSMRYVAFMVCFQYLVVWEMLSHAQTAFLATTVSALTRTNLLQTVLCFDEQYRWFYLIFCLFIFRADDSQTVQNPPPGEYFNMFVVCSWMQVMEPCL